MKKILATIGLFLLAAPLYAQRSTGSVTLSGSTCPGSGCTTLNVNDMGTASIQVTGTWDGTLVYEITTTGSDYNSVQASNMATGVVVTSTAGGTNGTWQVNVGALTTLRVRFFPFTSGSAVVVIKASANGSTGVGSGGGGSSGGDVNITQVGGTAISATNPFPVRAANSTGFVSDDPADGAPDAGNPVPGGGKVEDALSGLAALADAARAILSMDTDRALYTRSFSKADAVSGQASVTDGSSTSMIAASGASIRTAITSITCSNSSPTWVEVDIKDNTTVKMTIPCPQTTLGGGSTFTFPTPLIGTANTAWNADPSASATTIKVTAIGYKIR